MSVSPVNVGEVLAGKYQVERVLGVGGMGVVVAAKHLILGERVAIKFLLPQALARADVVERFIREGKAAARIRSEHIARVHDVGELTGGSPYLVMDYLDGQDLGVVLRKEGPTSIELTVEYVLQACLALAEAHALGIIHRDLKPSNLFLTKASDGSPTIKIIDFGISKIAAAQDGAPLPGDGEMTQTAVMMGSPLYMAPEQMASARDVDGRADIWSLGIILHTLLTGTPPFKAPSVMQVYELIVLGAPKIRKTRADVPEGLETAILRCLEKDRRRRFANVGELADAIAEFGPPHARFTADKVKRIVRQKTSHASLPPPSAEAAPPATAVTPPSMPSGAGPVAGTKQGLGDPPPAPRESNAAAADAKKPAPASTSTPDETPPPVNPSASTDASQPTGSSLVDPHATDGPWDQRTHPPTRGRPRVAVIAAAVGAVVVGAPLVFFLLRGQGAVAPVAPASDSAAAAQLATATAAAATAATATAPPAAPTATGPQVAPAATTTEVTPPPDPSASASARAPARNPTRRVAPPAQKKPSGDELFNNQGVIRR